MTPVYHILLQMISLIAALLLVHSFDQANSFSTNLVNKAIWPHNSLVRGTSNKSCLPTLMIPPCHEEKYKSAIHMIFNRRGRDLDTDTSAESAILDDEQDNSIASKISGVTNLFPWERTNSNQISRDMGDLTSMLNEPETDEMSIMSTNALSLGQSIGVGASVATVGVLYFLDTMDVRLNLSEVYNIVQGFLDDPNLFLQSVADKVASMGPAGAFYFGLFYTLAEVLAIPALPLTASAGYLFGVKEGTAIVLLSASIAAVIGFVLGRTFFRTYVENILEDKPEFKRIDKAIGAEGFKVILLLRLAPIFPFAFSNYLYGVTSVKFWPYFFGTMIGFAPGTFAYVYSGQIGKALTIESSTAQPWYVYALGLVLFSGLLKVVTDVATGIIKGLEEDDY